jgi:hypothetical protein
VTHRWPRRTSGIRPPPGGYQTASPPDDTPPDPAIIHGAAAIETPKRHWTANPCWEVEYNLAYAAHREELLAFAHRKKLEWEQLRHARLQSLSAKLGCPGESSLAAFIECLEGQLQEPRGLSAVAAGAKLSEVIRQSPSH